MDERRKTDPLLTEIHTTCKFLREDIGELKADLKTIVPRLDKAEHEITKIKTIGTTLTGLVSAALAYVGLGKQ